MIQSYFHFPELKNMNFQIEWAYKEQYVGKDPQNGNHSEISEYLQKDNYKNFQVGEK